MAAWAEPRPWIIRKSFGIRISGSDFGFWDSGFRFEVLSFEIGDLNFEFGVCGLWFGVGVGVEVGGSNLAGPVLRGLHGSRRCQAWLRV